MIHCLLAEVKSSFFDLLSQFVFAQLALKCSPLGYKVGNRVYSLVHDAQHPFLVLMCELFQTVESDLVLAVMNELSFD